MLEMIHMIIHVLGSMVLAFGIVMPFAFLAMNASIKRQRAKDDYYEKIIPGYERMTIKK